MLCKVQQPTIFTRPYNTVPIDTRSHLPLLIRLIFELGTRSGRLLTVFLLGLKGNKWAKEIHWSDAKTNCCVVVEAKGMGHFHHFWSLLQTFGTGFDFDQDRRTQKVWFCGVRVSRFPCSVHSWQGASTPKPFKATWWCRYQEVLETLTVEIRTSGIMADVQQLGHGYAIHICVDTYIHVASCSPPTQDSEEDSITAWSIFAEWDGASWSSAS